MVDIADASKGSLPDMLKGNIVNEIILEEDLQLSEVLEIIWT
jgi:hypothetical protein